MRAVDMSVLALFESPRRGGNTDTMMEYFLEGAAREGRPQERIYLRNLRISSCTECGACAETGRCAIQDDMLPLYGKLLGRSRVVFALPVFFLGPPAVSKAFIDRAQALWVRSRGQGKRAGGNRRGFLLSAGGFAGEKVFSCNRSIVRAFFGACGVAYRGEYLLPGMDEYGAVARTADLRDELRELGSAFARE
jgi:multimeric flavodoxin WrbA